MSDDQAPCATPATICEPSEVLAAVAGHDFLELTLDLWDRLEQQHQSGALTEAEYNVRAQPLAAAADDMTAIIRAQRQQGVDALVRLLRAHRATPNVSRSQPLTPTIRRSAPRQRRSRRVARRFAARGRPGSSDPEPAPPSRPAGCFSLVRSGVGVLAYLTRALRVGATWAEQRAYLQRHLLPCWGWSW
jgi:hypothetical protein